MQGTYLEPALSTEQKNLLFERVVFEKSQSFKKRSKKINYLTFPRPIIFWSKKLGLAANAG